MIYNWCQNKYFQVDSSTTNVFKLITNKSLNDLNAEESIPKETACNNSEMKYENCSTHSSKDNQDQNHLILNPDVYQE